MKDLTWNQNVRMRLLATEPNFTESLKIQFKSHGSSVNCDIAKDGEMMRW